jgi:2-polyprenyl-3-methyl-5-hydroxy-6-metoxy-1,4-benzoquinol methylase
LSATLVETALGSQPSTSAICPACDGRGNEPYLIHQGMTLLACRACGTVHLHPRPSRAEIQVMYTDAYQGATASYFAKVEKKLRRSRRRIASLAKLVTTICGAPARFLDIGCSGGFMVEAAREKGFEAHGLDIDPVSIDYARQHYATNSFALSTLEDYAAASPLRFDLIYCSEVIEHLADPRRFLEAVHGLLAPGGVFFLTTPDISHWRRSRDVTRWDGFCPPAHCVFFTPRSLTALLHRVGFVDIRRRLALKPGIKLTCRAAASI